MWARAFQGGRSRAEALGLGLCIFQGQKGACVAVRVSGWRGRVMEGLEDRVEEGTESGPCSATGET